MTKKEFKQIVNKGIAEGKEIMAVFVEIPGNTDQEMILNSVEDFDNKMKYYDKTYDGAMQHKHAEGVSIVKVEMCDSYNLYITDDE